MTEYWNYIITAIGLFGFWLAGKKVWWCWYVNIFNQVLWLVYGVSTQQWGFVVGVFVYTFVFTGNAIKWTKEHRAEKLSGNSGTDDNQSHVEFIKFDAEQFVKYAKDETCPHGVPLRYSLNCKECVGDIELSPLARYLAEQKPSPLINYITNVKDNYLSPDEVYEETKKALARAHAWPEKFENTYPKSEHDRIREAMDELTSEGKIPKNFPYEIKQAGPAWALFNYVSVPDPIDAGLARLIKERVGSIFVEDEDGKLRRRLYEGNWTQEE